MNCYDCALEGARRDAVAVCVDCGAAACLDHAHSELRWLTRTAAIYRVEAVEPAARSIRCATCATAQNAVAHPGARTKDHPVAHSDSPLDRLLVGLRR